MCGINAIIDFSNSKHSTEHMDDLVRMNARIQHRGPDANCVLEVTQGVYFGHLRLSIIDLSERGRQPMVKSGCTITYNGEIYNYIEIREELKNLGRSFVTETDTEVLIEAYLQWGVQAFSKFNGMWAFVLHDTNSNQFIVSRDRFGKKPLYYTLYNGIYYFTSELKALLEIRRFEINPVIAAQFLKWGWQEHAQETIVKDVYHFPKGSYAILNNENREQWKTQSYFSLDTISPLSAKDIGFNEAKAELRSLVFDSVNLRLRSDVDVAFALSGGIDSSIITAVAAEIKKEGNTHSTQLKTFSSVFTTKEMEKYNEKEYIDAVLKKVNGLKPHFISPGDEGFVEGMDQLLYIQDEPYFSAGMYAQQAVFRLIHESGVKVSLDGQGVDEAIGGYSSYNSIYLHQLWKEKNPLFIREMAGFAFYYPDLFADLMKQQLSSHGSSAEIMGKTFCEAIQNQGMSHVSGYHQNCRFQIDRLFLPALLHHQDRNSMAYAVESRSPFLDYRIVSFLLSIPLDYKIRNGKRKFILREAFKDLLPKEVYTRYAKLGFPAPLSIWMKNNHDLYLQLLKDAIDTGVVTDKVIPEFEKQKQVGYRDYLKFIRVIYLNRWISIFNVQT